MKIEDLIDRLGSNPRFREPADRLRESLEVVACLEERFKRAQPERAMRLELVIRSTDRLRDAVERLVQTLCEIAAGPTVSEISADAEMYFQRM